MAADWQNGGFGLYIHWPFCQSKCPYCDFNSHVAAEIDQERWARAYLAELERVAAETPNRLLQTVFFGGGTPSLMEPDLVATILERVRALWPMVNDPEITLEANPGSVEAGRFRGFRQAGVNRVSMGFQALNDTDLRALGRLHSVDEAFAALDVARDCFERVSFDLIYARQDQTLEAWEKELKQALSLAIDHLSLYQLTVEPGTAFGARYAAGGLHGLPGEDLSADMYELTQDVTGTAGFPAYEVSNHARPGSESRHNLIYWRYGDYAGIGPGAHGRLTLGKSRLATETHLAPSLWLNAVERMGSGESSRVALSPREQVEELVMMGLRVSDGVSLDRVSKIDDSVINANNIRYLSDIGLVDIRDHRLVATDAGRPVLNGILRQLLTG
ncbi:MAG: radical SAM family heme chaperone HemW [Brevirhabdus sp.]